MGRSNKLSCALLLQVQIGLGRLVSFSWCLWLRHKNNNNLRAIDNYQTVGRSAEAALFNQTCLQVNCLFIQTDSRRTKIELLSRVEWERRWPYNDCTDFVKYITNLKFTFRLPSTIVTKVGREVPWSASVLSLLRMRKFLDTGNMSILLVSCTLYL